VPTMALRAALVAILPALAAAEKYAVIAAGSAGFMNYRHQADACHAYQLMLKSGVPADNIILMMQDDVAKSSENPFPGQLFNKPGNDSPDVYKGCKIDYSGDIVTGKLFMDVLTGNSHSAKGKVLKSGPSDTVFVNFVDHGGPGIIAFPNGPVLTVKELTKTLKTMQSKNMFKQMVFYMEACESGSMFPKLKKDSKILAVTASNGKESSWGTYCGDAAVVKGKNVGSCLGDLFSVNWMEDDDLGKFSSETFSTQIAKVKKLTNKSHVCSFGDKSFVDEKIGDVELSGALSASQSDSAQGAVDARDVYVTQAMWAWQNAPDAESKEKAWKRLVGVVADREADEELFVGLAAAACSDVNPGNMIECQQKFLNDRTEIEDMDCHHELAHAVHEHCPASNFHHAAGGWNGFNMKFAQVLLNMCEGKEVLGKSTEQLVDLVHEHCVKASRSRAETQIVV
ncbi:dVPE, partial [Symbiodinium pilosum]